MVVAPRVATATIGSGNSVILVSVAESFSTGIVAGSLEANCVHHTPYILVPCTVGVPLKGAGDQ